MACTHMLCLFLTLNRPRDGSTGCVAQEHGLRRLKCALAAGSTPNYVLTYVVPFLAVLGSDQLCSGMCK